MKYNIDEYITDLVDRKKYLWRTVNIELPISLKEIINENIPEDDRIEDLNPQDEWARVVEVHSDKITLELGYAYSTKASKRDIENRAKEQAQEQINTLKENLDALCDKYEISMDELMNFISQEKKTLKDE